MKCVNCGKLIEDGSEFCYFCGSSFGDDEKTVEEHDDIRQDIDKEAQKEIVISIGEQIESEMFYNADSTYEEDSSVGKAIKIISIIILVLSVLGSFVIMFEAFVAGLVGLLISVLTSLLAYGIGEIVCLLTSINCRLK